MVYLNYVALDRISVRDPLRNNAFKRLGFAPNAIKQSAVTFVR